MLSFLVKKGVAIRHFFIGGSRDFISRMMAVPGNFLVSPVYYTYITIVKKKSVQYVLLVALRKNLQ